MAINNIGLGRGLDALIRETSTEKHLAGLQMVPVENLAPNANQPRKQFSEKSLEELAISIKSQGLLQPILVRPLGGGAPDKYEIIAGERRWRACQLAGLKDVPVIVRNLSAQDTLIAALVENLQREDLNPLEEAMGIHVLKEEFDLSQEDLSKKLGKSRSAIANSLRLLQLSEEIQKDLADGKISAGHGRALLSITDIKAQEYLRHLILEENLSVRETEAMAAIWKEKGKFRPENNLLLGTENSVDAMEEDGAKNSADANMPSVEEKTDAGSKKQNRPQSARLFDIQTNLGSWFNVPVRVTGGEQKGKISLSYTSREELDSILNKLALVAGESAGRSALPGIVRVELEGNKSAILEQRSNAALPHQMNLALDMQQKSDSPSVVPQNDSEKTERESIVGENGDNA